MEYASIRHTKISEFLRSFKKKIQSNLVKFKVPDTRGFISNNQKFEL